MLSYTAGMTAAPTAEANINTNRSSVRYLIFLTPCLLALAFGSSEYTLAETFAVQAPDHAADASNSADVRLGRRTALRNLSHSPGPSGEIFARG